MALVESDNEVINAGSFHSSGDGIGSATLDTSQDLSCTKELGSATTPVKVVDISIGSTESFMGLKLGKRTYLEAAVSGGSNSSKASPASSNATIKRSSQSTEFSRCQVEGCGVDLSSAKDYHRKHRVCETHSKSSKVIIRGLERRFCQQCSRFHSMSEFDQKKRSCRRRLSDHNARRRKPKPEIIQFNSLHSSLHEGRNQISFAIDQIPLVQTRPDSNSIGLFSPIKAVCSDDWNKPQETGFKVSYGITQPLQFKEAPVEVFHQGLQVSTSGNNSLDAAQNPSALSLLSTNSSWAQPLQHHSRSLGAPPISSEYWEQPSHRALSLLSTNFWGSCEADPTPPTPLLDHPLGLPTVSPEYWHQSISSVPPTTHFKEPNESSFYLY